jgi:predicted  nucleic acid-binding Zn-ribbon protein
MSALLINSDASALKLLEKLLDNPDADAPEVEFDGWPRFEMHVKGERYHSTITPELMESFLDLQKTINKAYALVRYSSSSSRRLTDADREHLKILVEVKEGSSGFVALLGEQFASISSGIAEGFKTMESKHKLIAILALGLLALGYMGFSDYLENQKEVRIAEVERLESQAERQERYDNLKLVSATSQAQAEKYEKLVSTVIERMPQLQTVSEHMAGTYDKLLASTKDADSVEVQGIAMPGRFVQEISSSSRNRSVQDRMAGVFRIRGVDHRSADEYKLTLFDVVRKKEIVATLPKDGSFVSDAILDVVQDAEWNGKVVKLQLITKTLSNKLVSAQIENVVQIKDQDAYLDDEASSGASSRH